MTSDSPYLSIIRTRKITKTGIGERLCSNIYTLRLHFLMRKTLVLVWHHRAGILHLLEIPCAVKYVLRSEGFKLCISKGNGLRHMPGFVPKPHSAEVGLGPAQFAERRTIHRLVRISLKVDQNHMNIVSRISKLNRPDKTPAVAVRQE